MRGSPFLPGWMLVALLVAPTLAQGDITPGEDDWHVTEDTTLVDLTKDVDGNVLLAPNVTLTLKGSTIRSGGMIFVPVGSTLELLPSSSNPGSRLTALQEGDPFWMDVQGNLVARGEAEIDRIWGDGLTATLPDEPGTLNISGHADLEGIHIHDSTAGIYVGKGASLHLRDALLENLGESAITTMGTVHIERSTLRYNEASIIGKDTCDIHVEDSTFSDALHEHLLINNCAAQVHRSTMERAGVPVVGNNAATVVVKDSSIIDYRVEGINSFSAPDASGGFLRPTIRFENVHMDGGGAEHATDLAGNEIAEFVNVTFEGHTGVIIKSKENTLSIRDSTFSGYTGYAIQQGAGMFVEDPAQAGNRFHPTFHEGAAPAAVSQLVAASFFVVEKRQGDIYPLPGDANVTVFSSSGQPMSLIGHKADGARGTQISFEAYTADAQGRSTFLGPFTYEVEHPALSHPATGDLTLERGLVSVVATVPPSVGDILRTAFTWALPALFVGGGGILLFMGLRKPKKGQDAQ